MSENDLKLCYTVSEKDYHKEQNLKNYEQIKKMLREFGVFFSVDNNRMLLSVDLDTYNNAKRRNAGRRKNVFHDDGQKDCKYYSYSDIVFMMQAMSDKEICEKTGIPQATFYRHKKQLKESHYYQSLDMNRLTDKEYLESVNGNFLF